MQRLFLSAVILGAVTTPLSAGSICGPGDNWLSSCAGGTYNLAALFSNGIDLTPSGGSVIPLVQFAGTSDISVGTLSGGTAPAVLNISATEIGGTATLEAVNSAGGLTQDPSNPGLADSFFDVFFDINLGGGLILHNDAPLVVTTVLDGLPIPPGTNFSESPLPLALYQGTSTTPSAFLLAPPYPYAPKTITPEPGTLITMAAGVLAVVAFRRRMALSPVQRNQR